MVIEHVTMVALSAMVLGTKVGSRGSCAWLEGVALLAAPRSASQHSTLRPAPDDACNQASRLEPTDSHDRFHMGPHLCFQRPGFALASLLPTPALTRKHAPTEGRRADSVALLLFQVNFGICEIN